MPETRGIPGYEGLYAAIDDGRIWSNRKGRFLKPTANKKGYLYVVIGEDHVNRKHEYAHRLVALAFIPNPDNLPEVNHKDRNKAHNHRKNLEWTTHQKNRAHAGKLAHDPKLQASKRRQRERERILDAIRLHLDQKHLIPVFRDLIDQIRGPERKSLRAAALA